MSSISTDALLSSAEIDATGRYRYSLVRHLTAKPSDRQRVLWIMLNPSTADASHDDPTIRRILSFSRAWAFDEVEVVNLYALRATDPNELKKWAGPVGPINDLAITLAVDRAELVVAAWGVRGGPSRRADFVLELADCSGFTLQCFGTTKNGQPRHPLYVPADTKLEAFPTPTPDPAP